MTASATDTPDFPAFSFSDHGGLNADSLRTFLVHCARNNVSDIFIQGGGPLVVDRFGRKIRASQFRIEPQQLAHLMDEIFSEEIKGQLKSGQGADRALQLNGDIHHRYGLARGERLRFRCNFIQATIGQHDMVPGVTLRTIPTDIPALESLGIEPDLFRSLLPHKGIGLVCGETGSGKSTLLAAIYQHCVLNDPHRKIVTFEDPIEFLLDFPDAILMPEQSQLKRDVPTFGEGLRLSLRRAPGIIGVGEIRDLDTLEGAISNGQSGHLCLSTMHTDSVGETIPRAINLFPESQREAMAHNLLANLQYVIIQRLLKTTDGRRQAIREYLVFDSDIRSALRDLPYPAWRAWIETYLHERHGLLADKAWALFQQGRIDSDELLTVITWHEREKREAVA